MGRTLGAEIRTLRLHRQMRQIDLARAVGHTHAAQINKYENGTSTPDAATLAKIATALGVPLEHFDAFGGAYDANAPRQTRVDGGALPALADTDPIIRLGGPLTYAMSVTIAATVRVHQEHERAILRRVRDCLDDIDAEYKS